jgi:outer membrane receptor protein involved in Fe transport
MKSYLKGSLLATTVIAGVTLSAPAFAQDPNAVPDPNPTNVQGTTPPPPATDQTPDEGVQSSESSGPAEPTSAQEIVVTGTLIRNPNLVASAPVTVVGQEEIQLRQTNVAEEVLRTIPGAAPSIGSNVNNGNGGGAFVNLRGIGSNRNIVLLDGVRIVPYDLVGRVDLNNIPLALVDRVDVLTGGASSTYGADAVGGVVNFITRSDFAGIELSASDQITERGDGNYLRGDLSIGANFDDGRGNAVLSVGYQESDPVYQGGERPDSEFSIDSYTGGSGGSSTTTPTRFDIGGGRPPQQIDPAGTGLVPYYQPFNFNPFNVFQVPFKRYNLFAAGHYDVTDNISIYSRGLYSNNTIDTIIAPSGVFGSAVRVPLSNPFLTPAQRAYFCANADFNPNVTGNQTLTAAECAAAATATSPTDPNFRVFNVGLRRRTTEVGPRISSYNTNIFDFRAGLRGDITENIGWDVWASRGESRNTQEIQNYVLLSRVRAALFATNTNTCLPNAPLGGSNAAGCVPLNVFGGPGSITPDSVDFITDTATVSTITRLSQARGTLNGDLPFASPWASEPVGFAVGTEYRKYNASQRSDVLAKTPGELGGAGGAQPDIEGGFDVFEGFAEVIAPLITDRPGFNSLTIEGGIRRSGYTVEIPGSPKYKTTTWKVAGSWEPIDDAKLRGNYQRAVRAPNIGELFTPQTVGLTNLGIDPCAGTLASNPLLNDPNFRATCIAQGAPPSTIGFITNPTAAQANAVFGGNPLLQPEKANTWTVGVVLKPRFLPGFNATVDYYNIKVTDAITNPTPADLINACFDAPSPTNPSCTIIQRNPITGGLEGDPATTQGLFSPLTNLGKILTDGVDVTFNYRTGLGTLMGAPAKLNLSFGGNWTRRNKFQATPTSINRECTGFYSVNCNPQPEYSFNQRSTLSLGRVDLSLLWRYIHEVEFEPAQIEEDGGPDDTVLEQFRNVDSYNYFDLSARFNVTDNFDMTVTVLNLLDKDPPFLGSSVGTTTFNSGNTFPSTYDALGRRFAVGGRIKF